MKYVFGILIIVLILFNLNALFNDKEVDVASPSKDEIIFLINKMMTMHSGGFEEDIKTIDRRLKLFESEPKYVKEKNRDIIRQFDESALLSSVKEMIVVETQEKIEIVTADLEQQIRLNNESQQAAFRDLQQQIQLNNEGQQIISHVSATRTINNMGLPTFESIEERILSTGEQSEQYLVAMNDLFYIEDFTSESFNQLLTAERSHLMTQDEEIAVATKFLEMVFEAGRETEFFPELTTGNR